ncbi:MAG: cytochrome C, partial [Gammaproteobacteria bacterium]|nr:cytochrome C [Gammaproteobacteria bacterium]
MLRTYITWLTIAFSLIFLPASSRAESIESVLMPGKVIEGHAELEGDCKKCHVRFKKSAQNALCLDDHKTIARDVSQKQGYH